jgi:hypothetical protein
VDESAQGEWRTGKVLTSTESRPRTGEWEHRGRQLSNDAGRGDRARDINVTSSESGVDKWERRGPLPPLESNERRYRGSGTGSRSSSAQFGPTMTRSSQHDGPADTSEWRSSKTLVSVPDSDASTFSLSSPDQ